MIILCDTTPLPACQAVAIHYRTSPVIPNTVTIRYICCESVQCTVCTRPRLPTLHSALARTCDLEDRHCTHPCHSITTVVNHRVLWSMAQRSLSVCTPLENSVYTILRSDLLKSPQAFIFLPVSLTCRSSTDITRSRDYKAIWIEA